MERNKLPKFRFNIYYREGQEVVVEADNAEEARERVMKGNFDTVGDSWDAGVASTPPYNSKYRPNFDAELVPDEPDED